MLKQPVEQRLRLNLRGQVQGIGFRPFIYRLARQLNLSGWVKNTAEGLLIEIQGNTTQCMLEQLKHEPPPRAIIESIEFQTLPCQEEENGFQILNSEEGQSQSLLPEDTAPCDECLKDLFDPQSRYYLYPFTSCTACGPRFSIAEQLPFDRCRSSMKNFPLCAACEKDYQNPDSRRFHAQTQACADCGPAYNQDFDRTAKGLLDGQLIAFKGPAGYQLIADAQNKQAITRLRELKHRPAKPFALMCLNPASVRLFAELSKNDEEKLKQPARAIVLLNKVSAILPEAIAPGLNQLGIMLPSTPAHYLIFHALAGSPKENDWLEKPLPYCLIVTSANDGSEAIIYSDQEAEDILKPQYDQLISHNRLIINGMDDSVIQTGTPAIIVRRSRGFAPAPIALAKTLAPGLALGAELKNSFCFNQQQQAFVSQYIGDMKTGSVIEFFEKSLSNWRRFNQFQPEYIACDLHPDFYTSQLAGHFELPIIKVQHHQAHLAAVAAEHQLTEPAIGLALDGYGMGPDHQAWGGELLWIDGHQYRPLGQLKPLPLPGGDKAALSPWRMATALLWQMGKQTEIQQRFAHQPQLKGLIEMLDKNINCPESSSCGRYFDAASALAGLIEQSHYEGQAAMLLEAQVTEPMFFEENAYIENHQLNLFPLFERLIKLNDCRKMANYFHGGLIQAFGEWLIAQALSHDIQHILLSGGCFLNKVLRQGLTERLAQAGLQVYLPQKLPPNDGGISLGQLWVAGQLFDEDLCV